MFIVSHKIKLKMFCFYLMFKVININLTKKKQQQNNNWDIKP